MTSPHHLSGTAQRQRLAGMANRLTVFRTIKAFIDTFGRWPTVDEIHERVPTISETAVRSHWHALLNADGVRSGRHVRRRYRSEPVAIMDIGQFAERISA